MRTPALLRPAAMPTSPRPSTPGAYERPTLVRYGTFRDLTRAIDPTPLAPEPECWRQIDPVTFVPCNLS